MGAEQLHQLILRAVGVLVLVDEEVLVAAVVPLTHLAGGLEQAHGFQQQVVEVERVGLGEFLFVDLEDVRDLLFHRVGAGEEVLLRVDHVVLRPGDAAERDARLEGLVVDAEPFDGGLDDGLLVGLVVDGEGAGEAGAVRAQRFDVAAQDADAEAVEGGNSRLRERAVAEDLCHALAHLLCGLVGEGDGEDAVGRDAALLDEISDAVGDDAGLAAARAGEQEHGPIDGENALALLRVHVCEEIGHRVHFSGWGCELQG